MSLELSKLLITNDDSTTNCKFYNYNNSNDIDDNKCSCCKTYIQIISDLQKEITNLKFDTIINKEDEKEDEKEEEEEEIFLWLDLSERRIEELLDQYYNDELFLMGYRGVVSFIYNYIIRDDDKDIILYKCTDQNKKIFIYQDCDGTINKDIKGKTLMGAIHDPLIKKVNSIYRKRINDIYEEDEKNSKKDRNDCSDDDDDDSDIDIDEVIVSELHFCFEEERKDIVDNKVNKIVNSFLEIKKYCSIKKNSSRKQIVEDLAYMLIRDVDVSIDLNDDDKRQRTLSNN
jgi:hypothetical protein